MTTDRRISPQVEEPNYHSRKWFSEKLPAIEISKIEEKMDKPVYLSLSILDISKIVMY